VPEPTESRITRLLGDRYELIELLGKGGFAGVYRVRNLRLQRTEALKVLSEMLTEDPDFAKRFEQEARVVAALDHPNIVKIYDYGAIEGFFWFSMQFIDGLSVGRQLRSRERLEDAASVRIAIGILDALHYGHARGVIHRDIKPDNILLDREGRPYLTDFGVAKSQIVLVKTQTGTLLGSPAYMSPEQLQGKPLDGRSDLYSVGVTVYKMLCGGLPFTSEDTFRATMKRLSEQPEPLSARRADVHPVLAEIVMRALERDPEQRYPDALSMREDLEGFLADITPIRTTRFSVPVRRLDEAPPTPAGTTPPRAAGTIPPDGAPTPSSLPPVSTPPVGPVPRVPPAAAATGRLRRLGWITVVMALVLLAAALLVGRRPASRPIAAPLATPVPSPRAELPIGSIPAPTAAPIVEPTAPTGESPDTVPANGSKAIGEKPEKRRLRPSAAATRPPHRAAPAPTSVPAPTAVPSPAPQPLVTGKRTPPEILEQAPLLLAPDLLAAHHNETVGMLVIVGADGRLKSARVISSVCPECDRAALEALRRFRFRPAADAKGNPIEGSFGFAMRIP
jgi:TonB family protein